MKKLLIFTDLDGTLLDYHSYSYLPALDALHRLNDLKIPVIINSSKTRSEIAQLREAMGNNAPYVVENGAAVIVPEGYFKSFGETEHVEIFGLEYAAIIEILSDLRAQRRSLFRGFSDFSDAQLADITGLSIEQARMAKQRLSTEPILWESSEADRLEFQDRLKQFGLTLVRGGRFFHVMGKTDKAVGLHWLVSRYKLNSDVEDWVTVALGDSSNDEAMLKAADIAVVVKSVNDEALNISHPGSLIVSTKPGPEGWREAVHQILDQFR